MDKITVSDLFFNSKESDGWQGENTLAIAESFLSHYPALKVYFTAEELAQDFLARL